MREYVGYIPVFISVLMLIVTLIGIYWKMREFVAGLHAQNLAMLNEFKSELASINTKIDPIWDWWNSREERRRR